MGAIKKMKRIRILTLLSIILLLTACSKVEQANPNEQFNEFVSYWENQKFKQMYDMFSKETKENISAEDSVERYEKIYEDLNIENVQISFTEFTEEELKTLKDEEQTTASIPFTVEMDSNAGPISFDYEAAIEKAPVNEEEDAEQSWYINWDPGFIHPELKDGGEIRIESIPPVRGEILDRNQMPLALNDKLYEIGIMPGELENKEQAIQQIANILNINKDTIETALNAGWVEDHLFVPITTILPSNETVYNQLMSIPGVQRKEENGRIYPGGEATAHLVGYIGDITEEFLEETDSDEYGPNDKVGKRGIEKQFEKKLKGKKGMKVSITKENDGEVVIAEKPVEDGENITLTIDINTQEKVYDSFGEDSGTAAAIHPKTGETLALVSAPAFDPNELLYGTSKNIWGKLEENEQNPLLNRFSATFAPGSVLKPITAAVGIKNGTLDPNEEHTIEGMKWGNGEGWGDYKVTRVSPSNGPVDLRDALERSDNIYFAMEAVKMKSKAFIEGFEAFGFGEDFPYEYPITTSTISADGKLDDEVLLANSSYGQGQLEMSAIHLAAAYTTFLNEGNMLKPILLTSEETEQIWKENLLSEEDADLIDDMLRSVVKNGTGKRAEKEANVPIAGKTGTVELKLSADTNGAINSWFVGYPHESQDILIALLVEETQNKDRTIATGKFVEIINQLHSKKEKK